MFADPTIADYQDLLSLRLEAVRERLARERNRLEREAAANSAYNGTGLGQVLGRLAQEEFDKAVGQVLGELRRAVKETTLDEDQLRDVTYQRLQTFTLEMRAHSGLEKFAKTNHLGAKPLGDVIEALPLRLSLYLRQFDVGFFGDATPEVLAVTNNNSVSIGTNVGNVQQGTRDSSQTMTIVLNATLVNRALDVFDVALAEMPDDVRKKLMPDVVALRAQASKPELSESVVREIGKSLRGVAEGIAGNAATPAFVAACTMLWSVLGIG